MKPKSGVSIHLSLELRLAAESVLLEGESLSDLVEGSLRETITHRQVQNDFIARGLSSRDESHRTGKYVSADRVLADLDGILKKRKLD
jgi:predicted transcriptional regulator